MGYHPLPARLLAVGAVRAMYGKGGALPNGRNGRRPGFGLDCQHGFKR
jgi:hypothetical protein